MLNSNQFVIAGDQSSSEQSLHYYKFTFGNTNTDWANKILWTVGTWETKFGEQLLSSDNQKIYSIIDYGATALTNIYFMTFNLADGAVIGSRYVSILIINFIILIKIIIYN